MSRRSAYLYLSWVVAVTCVASANAATLTWDGGGGDNDIDTAANWNPNQTPATGDFLIFDGSTRTLPQLVAALTVGSVSFNSTAAAFTIGGNKTLTINSGGIVNNSANTQTITIAVKLNADQIWDTASGGLTISGVVSGSGNGITKNGSGTLTLSGSGDNGYTGTTTVNAGTLLFNKTAGKDALNGALVIGDGLGGGNADITRLLAANQIPDAKIVTVNSSGLFDLNGFSETIHTLNLEGGNVSLGNGGSTLTINTALNVNDGSLSSGNGNVTMSSATVSLTGGSIAMGTGTLTLGGDVTGVASSSTATISGNVSLGTSTREFAIADGSAATDMRISAVVTGTGDLTKSGAGLLELASGNSYSGDTTVEAGILSIKNNTALGTTGGATSIASGATLQIDGSGLSIAETASALAGTGVSGLGALRNLANNNTWSGNITLDGDVRINSDGGTLTLSGNIIMGNGEDLTVGGAGNTTIGGIIGSGNGQLLKDGAGVLALSGANTYTGTTTVNAGTLSIGADNNLGTAPGSATVGKLTLNGGELQSTATFTLNANRGISLGASGGTINTASGTMSYSGILAGSGALTKSGTGTLNLGGANTFLGTTAINAGAVGIQHNSALGTTTATTVADGGAIHIDGSGLSIAEPISSFTGTGVSNGGALRNLANNNTWSGNITLSAGGGQINSDSGNLTISGIISGAGGSLTKGGAGAVTLNGNNSYTGATAVSAGTLRLGASGVIHDSSAVSITGGATLDVNGKDETIGSLAGAGNVTLGAGNLIAGGLNTSTTHSGVISGSGGVTKTGTGTLILSGNNTYSGATAVNGGVLRVPGSNANSVFTVNNGGTISGAGTIGDLILVSGGTVSPGASPGTLHTGSQTWSGGANYTWEINKANGTKGADPGWDFLNIGGTLSIGGSSGNKVNIRITSMTLGGSAGQASSFDSSQNYAWTIATASGGISGFDALKFNLDASAFQNGLNGGSFGISQSGNDVSLTFSAVPEPHEYAMAVGVGLLGFAVWHRKFRGRRK